MGWQLLEAKARLSDVIKKAQAEGPQHITVRGASTAVVLSEVENEQLVSAGESLVDFLHHSPLYGMDDIEFPRGKSQGRELVL